MTIASFNFSSVTTQVELTSLQKVKLVAKWLWNWKSNYYYY